MLVQAILARGLSGLCCHATVVYDNTTTIDTGFAFLGTTDVNGDLTSNIDINEMTLAPGSTGDQITSLTFQATAATSLESSFQPDPCGTSGRRMDPLAIRAPCSPSFSRVNSPHLSPILLTGME